MLESKKIDKTIANKLKNQLKGVERHNSNMLRYITRRFSSLRFNLFEKHTAKQVEKIILDMANALSVRMGEDTYNRATSYTEVYNKMFQDKNFKPVSFSEVAYKKWNNNHILQNKPIKQWVDTNLSPLIKNWTDDALKTAERRLKTLAKTVGYNCDAMALRTLYKENNDKVLGYRWVTKRDSRVCPLCVGLSDVVFKNIEDAPFRRHWNCRCNLLPVFKGAGEDTDTFEKWFSKRSEAQQRSSLGKERTLLYRAGKLQFSDLLRDDYSLKLLDELQFKKK